jgi:hypothetical protein
MTKNPVIIITTAPVLVFLLHIAQFGRVVQAAMFGMCG